MRVVAHGELSRRVEVARMDPRHRTVATDAANGESTRVRMRMEYVCVITSYALGNASFCVRLLREWENSRLSASGARVGNILLQCSQ